MKGDYDTNGQRKGRKKLKDEDEKIFPVVFIGVFPVTNKISHSP
jgi:hypothetical protein